MNDTNDMNVNGIIINPNCSEVVFDLSGMTRSEALERLARIGIVEFYMPSSEFWSHFNSNDMETMLGDKDNPNIPDFSSHAYLELQENFDGFDLAIIGHEDCQSQMFPTMYKIENEFLGEWQSGGGNTNIYEKWVDSGHWRDPLINFQDDQGIFKRHKYMEISENVKINRRSTEDPDSEI